MGVLKNGVGRPSNETIKKKNIFKVTTLVLLVGIIGLTAYILNDKGIIKVNNDKNNNEKNTVVTEENKNLTNEEVLNIFKRIFTDNLIGMDIEPNGSLTEQLKSYLTIQNSSSKIEKYNCEDLFGTDLKLITENIYTSNSGWCIEGDNHGKVDQEMFYYDDANKTYKSLFGNDNNMKKDDISLDFLDFYDYSKIKDAFVHTFAQGGDCSGVYFYSVQSAEIKSSKLEVIINSDYVNFCSAEEEMGILKLTDGTNLKLSIVDQFNYSLEDGTVIKDNEFITDERIAGKMNLNTKYTFFKEDGVYKLESIETID